MNAPPAPPTSLPGRAPAARAPGRAGLAAAACLLGLLAVAIFVTPGLSESLQYDRAAVARGEVWRVVTCHWTHWSWDHLLWDVAAFVALAHACAVRCPRRLPATLLYSAVAIPIAVWFAQPGLVRYRGLSGIDSALMGLLAVTVACDAKHRGVSIVCGTLLAAFAAKIAFELTAGRSVFVNSGASGFVPVPLAHAVGGAIGGLIAVLQPRSARGA